MSQAHVGDIDKFRRVDDLVLPLVQLLLKREQFGIGEFADGFVIRFQQIVEFGIVLLQGDDGGGQLVQGILFLLKFKIFLVQQVQGIRGPFRLALYAQAQQEK